MRSVSCRYFTVYGERAKEDHAVIAMIARAFTGQDPFEVWGDGRQVRNWTHVEDIVEGTVRAAELVDDGTAINLGTMERTSVLEAAHEVLRLTGRTANVRLRPDMPTGPMNRVADNRLACRLLGWEPRVSFREGLSRTIHWYFAAKEADEVGRRLEYALTER
jgi:nucleoside-diphosphate-sugar epimerase